MHSAVAQSFEPARAPSEDTGAWATSLARLLRIALRQIDADRGAAKAALAQAISLLQIGTGRTRGGPPESSVPGGLAGWQVRVVLSFIAQNSERSIRVAELSDVARLSASHFSRAFRRSFGEAPRDYLIRQRVDHARHLMLISEMALSEVAQACGFTDQAHFSRNFRTVTGYSPGAWRRAYKQSHAALSEDVEVSRRRSGLHR
ncbi:MAG: AraC family transcriptional regulator [Alphaproteobacteria bacterium]|nr:AraC family transcriptional regulator [Alphaproteobacteria bacterium]